jgi:signal transduction histidine kinase
MTRVAAIARGLAIFAAAWHVLWLVSDDSLRRVVWESPTQPAVMLLLGSLIVWCALWPSMFGPWRNSSRLQFLQIASLALITGGGMLLLANPTAAGTDGWLVGASVLNLAAGLAGLYLVRRAGVLVVLAIVSAEIVMLFGISEQLAYPIDLDLIYPLYALALGMAAVASRHTLIASARSQDASLAQLGQEQIERASSDRTTAAVAQAETRLHETVLNTLTAIVRGGLDTEEATQLRLRQRAGESAEVLRAIVDGVDIRTQLTGDLRVDLAQEVAELQSRGVTVGLAGPLDRGAFDNQVPPATFTAIASAAREALLNVVRHAQASEVSIEGQLTHLDGQTQWQVHIRDDGCGFDVAEKRYGLESVIGDGIAACGGSSSITSSPGNGTTVTIDVGLTDIDTHDAQRIVRTGPLNAIGIPVVIAFSVLSMYSVIALWNLNVNVIPNVAAVGVLVAMVVAFSYATKTGRHRYAPWWLVAVIVVGVPLMIRWEAAADAQAVPMGEWSSEIGAALFFVVVATGPAWVTPIALAAWLLAQDSGIAELTQPGSIVIVVAAVLGWQLRRADRRMRLVNLETQAERLASTQARKRLTQARGRYEQVDADGLIAVLEGIAEGRIDPRDESVRVMCVREERLLRALMRLDPEHIAVHRDLVALAVAARDATIDLSISVPERQGEMDPKASLALLPEALALVQRAIPDSQARASISSDPAGCIFRLVVQVPRENLPLVSPQAELLDDVQGLVALEERCASASFGDSARMDTPDAQSSLRGG